LVGGQPVAISKANDTGMLQKPPNNALYTDIFEKARNLRPEAADTAHNKVNFDPRLARLIELVDDPGVHQRVELGPDLPLPACPGMRDFVLNMADQAPAQIDGREGEKFQILGLGVARNVVKDLRHIAGKPRVAGEH